jgi:hypothetical protein
MAQNEQPPRTVTGLSTASTVARLSVIYLRVTVDVPKLCTALGSLAYPEGPARIRTYAVGQERLDISFDNCKQWCHLELLLKGHIHGHGCKD